MPPSNRRSVAKRLRHELGYLDEHETAALIGVETLTLRNRAYRGEAPPSYKLGKDRLYKRDEVAAWIARRRVN